MSTVAPIPTLEPLAAAPGGGEGSAAPATDFGLLMALLAGGAVAPTPIASPEAGAAGGDASAADPALIAPGAPAPVASAPGLVASLAPGAAAIVTAPAASPSTRLVDGPGAAAAETSDARPAPPAPLAPVAPPPTRMPARSMSGAPDLAGDGAPASARDLTAAPAAAPAAAAGERPRPIVAVPSSLARVPMGDGGPVGSPSAFADPSPMPGASMALGVAESGTGATLAAAPPAPGAELAQAAERARAGTPTPATAGMHAAVPTPAAARAGVSGTPHDDDRSELAAPPLTASRASALRALRATAGEAAEPRAERAESREPGGDQAPAVVPGTSGPGGPTHAASVPEDAPRAVTEPRAHPVEQLAVRLSRVRGDGPHELSVRLDPPELGGVQVDARLDGARLTVRIHTEQAAARELLVEALPRLRAALAEQGFVPGEVSVQLGLDSSPRGRGGDERPVPTPFAAVSPAPPPRPVRATPPIVRAADGLDLWA